MSRTREHTRCPLASRSHASGQEEYEQQSCPEPAHRRSTATRRLRRPRGVRRRRHVMRRASHRRAPATGIDRAGPLAAITVTPNPQTMAAGATQQFTAVGQDAGGNVVTIAPTWTVIAGGGTISASGLFTAGATAGTFGGTVRASIGSLAG